MDAVGKLAGSDRTGEVRAWVDATCRDQGLASKITDPVTILKIAGVLASDSPDGSEARRMVGVRNSPARWFVMGSRDE